MPFSPARRSAAQHRPTRRQYRPSAYFPLRSMVEGHNKSHTSVHVEWETDGPCRTPILQISLSCYLIFDSIIFDS